MSLGDTDIQGNANVSRHLNVGGRVRVEGDAEFGHGLRVRGYLDAPNVKGPSKGLFLSPASLREAYPKAEPGWWALVGNGFPAAVYVASADGGWINSGGTSGSLNIDGNGVVMGGVSGESGDGRVSDEEMERIGSRLAEDFFPTLMLDDLDTLGTDGSLSAMQGIARGLRGRMRYAVLSELNGGVMQIGVLDLISDSMRHVVTEIFTTHATFDNYDPQTGWSLGTSHSDSELWTYYRSFNLSAPGLANERGTWTAWKILSGLPAEDASGKRFQRFDGVATKGAAFVSLGEDIPMTGAQLLYDPDFGFFLRIKESSSGGLMGPGVGVYHDYANWVRGNATLGIPAKWEVGPNAGTLYICPTGIWGMAGGTFMELMHI